MAVNLTEIDGGIVFDVRVAPRASKSEVVGEYDGALKVRISSPPARGAANAELIRLFAKVFGVSRGQIEIVSGDASKNKRIKIQRMSQSRFKEVTG